MLGRRDLLTGGYSFNFRMVEFLRKNGIDTDVVHFRTVPEGLSERRNRAARYIYRHVLKSKPDVIIVSKSYQYVPLLRIFSSSLRIPVVYLIHQPEWKTQKSWCRSILYRTYTRWILGMAHTVWVNSRSTGLEVEKLGIQPGRIVIITPGFDRPGTPLPDRSERSGPVRLLSVGSFIPVKAHDVLVKACSKLPPGSFTLDLVGGTNSKEDCSGHISELIRTHQLEDSIRILGEFTADELGLAYRNADILVHPSRWESFGITLIEAMSLGLPVVASDVAAIPELIHDGKNGLLVPPGDVDRLASAIRSLIDRKDIRLEMGARSQELASKLNDWDETGKAFFRLVAIAADWKIPGEPAV
jgi:glycosyltransferase involved in cell wall biosynthesis